MTMTGPMASTKGSGTAAVAFGSPTITFEPGARVGGTTFAGGDELPRPKVLVIDDDPLVRMVIEAALETFGDYEVWTAGDGETGLSMLTSGHPAFVFLDLLIPGKNGFAVLEELQKRGPAVDGMRVVVTSGLMGAPTLERLAALGSPEILPKPFRLNDLRQIMCPSPAPKSDSIAAD
jgi:CheY-like chemotaxis protein